MLFRLRFGILCCDWFFYNMAPQCHSESYFSPFALSLSKGVTLIFNGLIYLRHGATGSPRAVWLLFLSLRGVLPEREGRPGNLCGDGETLVGLKPRQVRP